MTKRQPVDEERLKYLRRTVPRSKGLSKALALDLVESLAEARDKLRYHENSRFEIRSLIARVDELEVRLNEWNELLLEARDHMSKSHSRRMVAIYLFSRHRGACESLCDRIDAALFDWHKGAR